MNNLPAMFGKTSLRLVNSLILVASLSLAPLAQAQLIGDFTFTGNVGSTNLNPTNVAPNVLISPASRVGVASASGLLNNDNLSSSNWPTGGFNAGRYVSFTVAPDGGEFLTLRVITFTEAASVLVDGPRNWEIRSSADGFAAPLASGAIPNNLGALIAREHSVALVGPAFTNLVAGVEFRIYGYNSGGALGVFRIDDIRIEGEVSVDPQEPSLGIYTFDGNTGSNSVSASNVAPGVDFDDFARSSAVSTPTPANHGTNVFTTASWSTANTASATRYVSFTVRPETGNVLDLTGLIFTESRNSNSIRRWEVRSSVDDFSSVIGTLTIPNANTDARTADLVLDPALYSDVNEVEFRFYGIDAVLNNNTRFWRLDNVSLLGRVEPVAPLPEIVEAPAGVSDELVMWYKGESFDGTIWENVSPELGVGNAVDIDSDIVGGISNGGVSAPPDKSTLADFDNVKTAFFDGEAQLYVPNAFNVNGRDAGGGAGRRFTEKSHYVAFSPELSLYPNGAVTRSTVYEQGARAAGFAFYVDVRRNGASGDVTVAGGLHNTWRNPTFDGFEVDETDAAVEAFTAGSTPVVVAGIELNGSSYESSVILGTSDGTTNDGFRELRETNSSGHSFLGEHGGATGIGAINSAVRYQADDYVDPVFGTDLNVNPSLDFDFSNPNTVAQNDPFRGHISDVIQYNRKLTANQTLLLRNYFSAKFGYRAPDLNGQVTELYQGDELANAGQELTAIYEALDPVSGLERQDQARSDEYLAVLKPSALASGVSDRTAEYLLIGHDTAPIEAIRTTDVPAGYNHLWNRTYAAQQTDGNALDGARDGVGTVSLAFRLEGLGNVNPNHIKLIVKNRGTVNNNFSNTTNIVEYDHATFDGRDIVFENVDLRRAQNNQWVNQAPFGLSSVVTFTLASTNAATSLSRNSGAFLRVGADDASSTSDNATEAVSNLPLEAVVYPNPATAAFAIRLGNHETGASTTVTLTDLMGRQVFSQTFTAQDALVVPVDQLANGLYSVSVSQGQRVSQTKFVKN